MTKFDYIKWVTENKYGLISEQTGSLTGSEATGSIFTGSEATGSEATGSEATGSEATGSVCDDLEGYAMSLGITPGTPGVQGTIMSATDQFCIKCQAGSYQDLHQEQCACCEGETGYTYDDNVVTFNPQDMAVPSKGPGKTKSKMGPITKPTKDPFGRMRELAGLDILGFSKKK